MSLKTTSSMLSSLIFAARPTICTGPGGIDRLPPGYRTVFVLHDVQGYEHNEIAGIMGCSVGNSKSQLHKARTKLRDLLQEEIREQARQVRHAAKTQTGHGD